MKRKFQVGDVFKIRMNEEAVKVMIIDFDTYGGKTLFKIALPRGEMDVDEEQLKRLKKEAKCLRKEL